MRKGIAIAIACICSTISLTSGITNFLAGSQSKVTDIMILASCLVLEYLLFLHRDVTEEEIWAWKDNDDFI